MAENLTDPSQTIGLDPNLQNSHDSKQAAAGSSPSILQRGLDLDANPREHDPTSPPQHGAAASQPPSHPEHHEQPLVTADAKSGESEDAAEEFKEEGPKDGNSHGESIQHMKDRMQFLEERLQKLGLLGDLDKKKTTKPTKDGRSEPNDSTPQETSSLNPAHQKEDGSGAIITETLELADKPEESLGDAIQGMQERISAFEKLIGKEGSLPKKQKKQKKLVGKEGSLPKNDLEPTSDDKESLPAIPRIRYVEWQGFKNKFGEEKQVYAIEVLIGGAKYYYQQGEEESKRKGKLEDNRSWQMEVPEIKCSLPNRELPERIRVNSKHILSILEEMDEPIVILRPFKPLVYHENRIRETFQRLEEKWGEAEKKALSEEASAREFAKESNKDERRAASGQLDDQPASETQDAGELKEVSDPAMKQSAAKEPDEAISKTLSDTVVAPTPMSESKGKVEESETLDRTVYTSVVARPDEKQGSKGSSDITAAPEVPSQDAMENETASIETIDLSTATGVEGQSEKAESKPKSTSVSGKSPVATILAETRSKSPKSNNDQKKSMAPKQSVSRDTILKGEEPEDQSDSLEALRDLRCLVDFMDEELKPLTNSLKSDNHQKISFSNLWHIFKPGELVIAPLGRKTEAEVNLFIPRDNSFFPRKPTDRYQELWRVISTSDGRPNLRAKGHIADDFTNANDKVNSFCILTYAIDFSGSRFEPHCYKMLLKNFKGERDITSLDVYPLRFSPQAHEIKAKWKARGEKFCEYITFKHKYYSGKTLICGPNGLRRPSDDFPKHAETVDSQVVVDFSEALSAHPGWATGLYTTAPNDNAPREFSEDYPTKYWKDRDQRKVDRRVDDDIYFDAQIDLKLSDEYKENDGFLKESPDESLAEDGQFEEDHLVLLPNRVFAFVLRSRKFASLTIDGLRPVKRHVEGFNDLKLPYGHKHTVRSLVHNHFANKEGDLQDLENSHDADLVRGKGNGLIILLHGAPGVGKTSTAECVAEAFGKLLLPITCGDLGLTAAEVEKELSEKFHLAELWGCVLLLDEADVFLASRTNTDVTRNSLVSVFLRTLEYFTGILFLTTNRVGSFDEAFKSRIHISLYYPPLDWPQTDQIWKMNLRRLTEKKQRRNETLHLKEDEIFAYAWNHYTFTSPEKANWNGRQIRNAFQTAAALAEYEAQEKNAKAQEKVMKAIESGYADARFVPVDPILKVQHFRKVAQASYEFDCYISDTKGFTDAELAYQNAERRDDFDTSSRPFHHREQHVGRSFAASAAASNPRSQQRSRSRHRLTRQGTHPSAAERNQRHSKSAHVFGNEAPYDHEQGSSPDEPPSPRREANMGHKYGPQASVQDPRGGARAGAQQRVARQVSPDTRQEFFESPPRSVQGPPFGLDENRERGLPRGPPAPMTGGTVVFHAGRSDHVEVFQRRPESPQGRRMGNNPLMNPSAIFDYGDDDDF